MQLYRLSGCLSVPEIVSTEDYIKEENVNEAIDVIAGPSRPPGKN